MSGSKKTKNELYDELRDADNLIVSQKRRINEMGGEIARLLNGPLDKGYDTRFGMVEVKTRDGIFACPSFSFATSRGAGRVTLAPNHSELHVEMIGDVVFDLSLAGADALAEAITKLRSGDY